MGNIQTASIDIQNDGIEVEIAERYNGESLSRVSHKIYGDPSAPEMWMNVVKALNIQ